MDGTGGFPDAYADEHAERDHELRAALYGIESAALALKNQREHLPCSDVDQLALTIAAEARRLQLLLAPRPVLPAAFELAEAIRPAVVMARCSGVTVRDAVPDATWVEGSSHAITEVVFALLDNARVHAPDSPIDLRVTMRKDTITLFIEDRGRGIDRNSRERMFERGVHDPYSSGSGLGLFIARKLMLQQGGSLTAQRRRGGGESFALTLPRARGCPNDVAPLVSVEPVAVR